MNPKFLAVAISTALLAACGGDDNNSNNNDSKSPLVELGIQCAAVEKAATETTTGTLQLSLVDSYFPVMTSPPARLRLSAATAAPDQLYVVERQRRHD